MRGAERLFAASAFALTVAMPLAAEAYCRTSSCPGNITGAVCVPALPTDCGVPLKWPTDCVGFSLQQDASSQVTLNETQAIFEKAFATWMNADCGDGSPRIRVSYAGPIACEKHEYNQDQGNANAIVYRDTEWPHPGQHSTLALTTVTYNLDTGEIYDADMELNTAGMVFSTTDDPSQVTFDLLSVVTHETGHFLGLSHSQDGEATMYSDYISGTTKLRDLHPDDVAGICAIYPPGAPISGSCSTTPRHGYSADCASDQPAAPAEISGCSCVVGSNQSTSGGLFFALLLTLGLASRRREPRV